MSFLFRNSPRGRSLKIDGKGLLGVRISEVVQIVFPADLQSRGLVLLVGIVGRTFKGLVAPNAAEFVTHYLNYNNKF